MFMVREENGYLWKSFSNVSPSKDLCEKLVILTTLSQKHNPTIITVMLKMYATSITLLFSQSLAHNNCNTRSLNYLHPQCHFQTINIIELIEHVQNEK